MHTGIAIVFGLLLIVLSFWIISSIDIKDNWFGDFILDIKQLCHGEQVSLQAEEEVEEESKVKRFYDRFLEDCELD